MINKIITFDKDIILILVVLINLVKLITSFAKCLKRKKVISNLLFEEYNSNKSYFR